MWDDPIDDGNGEPKKKAPKTSHARKEPRVPLHLKRVTGRLQPSGPSPAIPINIVLYDVSLNGIGIFVSEQVPEGEFVQISFDEARAPQGLRGRVAWCHYYGVPGVIKPGAVFPYRIGIRLQHDTPELLNEVKAYLVWLKSQQLSRHA